MNDQKIEKEIQEHRLHSVRSDETLEMADQYGFKWIDVTKVCPRAEQGKKVLGHNGEYAFECEFDEGFWCNVGGETMTHWMPLPDPPKPN